VPETRTEWVLFLLGIGVIGALAAAVFYSRTHDDPAVSTRPAVTSPRASGAVTSHSRTTEQAPPTTTSGGSTTTTRTTSAGLTLRLAAQNDTWISVQSGSSTGRVLWQGTLASGESRRFTASSFWVRFGAAADVNATLDGKTLPLPSGTYSAPITKDGLGAQTP
jgi:cytoskeletal protein RodZ